MKSKVSVLITHLNDPRVFRTISSLKNQTLKPYEIIIADGGSNKNIIDKLRRLNMNNLRVEIIPGSVSETRYRAVKIVKGDIIAFIDSDEVAPPHWLEKLTEPIVKGDADFTGGPTYPLNKPTNLGEKIAQKHEEWFYKVIVPNDITTIAAGNSAFKREIFDYINFDPNFKEGGEDYDLLIRAVNMGYRGKFVKDAWVWHDLRYKSFYAYIKKRFKYLKATTQVYLKNKNLMQRINKSFKRYLGYDYFLIELILKAFAFLIGIIEYKRRF